MRDVESWGNPIGFSATNMRYVTITKSRFYNNAIGIVPNALDSEKFPPAEDNMIRDNDIFWNNFNFHEGAPFKPKKTASCRWCRSAPACCCSAAAATASRTTAIYGNYLVGVAAVEGILLDKTTEARALIGNQIARQRVRRWAATDLNGRDLAYDGNGSGNCWGPNTGVADHDARPTARRSRRARSRARTRSARTRRASCSASPAPNALKGWIKHPHTAKPGYTPLEVYKK